MILTFEVYFAVMPYTKEEIEDKLRKALDACYVVCFVMLYSLQLIACSWRGCGYLVAWYDGPP